MRWTRIPENEVSMRYGADYWNKRAEDLWEEVAHGAFGSTAAMRRAHSRLAFGLSGARRPRHVLEMGCGFGGSYPVIRSAFPSARYCGVDCCRTYIEEARKHYPEESWIEGDAMTLVHDPVDLVVMCATVSSLESVLPSVIQRAFDKWIEPGGQLLIAEENWFMLMEGPL